MSTPTDESPRAELIFAVERILFEIGNFDNAIAKCREANVPHEDRRHLKIAVTRIYKEADALMEWLTDARAVSN